MLLKVKLAEAWEMAEFELSVFIKHRKGIRKANKFHNNKPLKLHLASGDVYKKGWVNIDLDNKTADLNLDLRRDLPFPDNSCDEIYSEHFLEHLPYPDAALFFLKDLKRVIKPGGKVTTCVPDTTWPMQSFIEGENAEYFKIARERNWHPGSSNTLMEHVNYHFRQNGEHHFAYDEETLLYILNQAGFSKSYLREFDPEMDSANRHPGTLCAVSIK